MDFIKKLMPFAQKHGKASGVLPALILAQGVLESNSGRSGLAIEANNLFGIKAGSTWNGPTITKQTKEYDKNGKPYTVQAAFRRYSSYEGAVQDLCIKYRTMARYKAVLFESDYRKAARAVQAAGYATDPAYADKLIAIIEKYKLDSVKEAPMALNWKDVRDKIAKHKTKKFSTRPLHTIITIAIHHSETAEGSSKSFAEYHVNHNGWAGIGYHFVILPDGTIEYCGSMNTIRANVANHNPYIIGICFVGNFSKDNPPNDVQIASGQKLIDYLVKEIPTIMYMKGHKEFKGASTTCPGFDFKRYLKLNGRQAPGDHPTIVPNPPKGDDEMVRIIKIQTGAQVATVNAINKDGREYVKLSDLAQLGLLQVRYDEVKKMPVVDKAK